MSGIFSIFDEVFTYDALAHATAGTGGGFVAMTAFYPLDHIRTRLQIASKDQKGSLEAIKEMIEKEGISSLYTGLGPVLFSLACSNFVYFYAYNCLKAIEKKNGPISTFKNLFIAAVAGVINVYATCPLWVVSTRLRIQQKNEKPKYLGMLDGLQKVYQEEGFQALWGGSLASLVLVSNPTIQFVAYDKLKLMLGKKDKDITSLEVFLLGAASKLVATLLTYPIQVAQSIMRTQSGSGGKHGNKPTTDLENQGPKKTDYKNTFDCLIRLFQKEGIFGWFKGLDVKVIQTVMTAAFHFLAYEKIVSFIFAMLKRGK